MTPTRPCLRIITGLLLIAAMTGMAVQGRQVPTPPAKQNSVGATPLAVTPDNEVNRSMARRQLDVIEEAWAMFLILYRSRRIEPGCSAPGVWGSRRLKALRQAGAGKVEIIAALEKYRDDLNQLEQFEHDSTNHHHPTLDEEEIRYLRIEAEMWLNEERSR